MIADFDQWRLPGIEVFLGDVADGLREGQSIVLQLPDRAPRNVGDWLRRLVRKEADLLVDDIICRDGDPVGVLYEELAERNEPGQLKSIERLCEDPGFQGRVIVLEVGNGKDLAPWLDFLERFAAQSRSVSDLQRTRFFLPLAGELADRVPKEDVLLVVKRWDGVLAPRDLLFPACSIAESLHSVGLVIDLAASITIELSKWDLDLLSDLAARPLKQLLQPFELLRDLAGKNGFHAGEDQSRELLWRRGGGQTFDDAWHLHSLLLAANGDEEAIAHRVWIGQVKVLFPYIELRRQDILRRYRTHFTVPFTAKDGKVIDDVKDLELGHLFHQCSTSALSLPKAVRQYIKVLRDARNALAHTDPIKWHLIDRGLLEPPPWNEEGAYWV